MLPKKGVCIVGECNERPFYLLERLKGWLCLKHLNEYTKNGGIEYDEERIG